MLLLISNSKVRVLQQLSFQETHHETTEHALLFMHLPILVTFSKSAKTANLDFRSWQV